ncbi:MAG TPA: hypothetical protein VF750_04440 [Sphingomicrobium sp.]
MLLASLLLSLAQAPAAAPPASIQSAPVSAPRRPRRLFFSPMGEPFRAKARDDNTLADWFAQADANRDARITIDEMQGDASRFFAVLDVNKDGEIDPDEITRYENEIAPEVRSGEHFALALDGSDANAGAERGSRRRGPRPGLFRGAEDVHQGAGRYGLLDLPEPVVSADSDFNRGVSLAEFRRAAQQRFLALDLDHHGYLTLAELERIRPAPPASQNAPDQPRQSGESAPPQR